MHATDRAPEPRALRLAPQKATTISPGVFALDSLGWLTGDAELYERADARMAEAEHFITERDRVDRHAGARRQTRPAHR